MSQTSPDSRSQKLLTTLLAILVIASMASVDVNDWRRRTSAGAEKYMKFIGDWDTEYHMAAGKKGLFVRFQHLRGNAQQEVSRVYFRGVYQLYPQPFIAAREGSVINLPTDLRLANLAPEDDALLIKQGVGAILIVDGRNGYDNPLSPTLPVVLSTTRPMAVGK